MFLNALSIKFWGFLQCSVLPHGNFCNRCRTYLWSVQISDMMFCWLQKMQVFMSLLYVVQSGSCTPLHSHWMGVRTESCMSSTRGRPFWRRCRPSPTSRHGSLWWRDNRSVCVCVCVRACTLMHVWVWRRENVCVWEHIYVCLCVYVCVCEFERGRMCVCVCASISVCVCVWGREGVWERECVSVCVWRRENVYMRESMYVCVHMREGVGVWERRSMCLRGCECMCGCWNTSVQGITLWWFDRQQQKVDDRHTGGCSIMTGSWCSPVGFIVAGHPVSSGGGHWRHHEEDARAGHRALHWTSRYQDSADGATGLHWYHSQPGNCTQSQCLVQQDGGTLLYWYYRLYPVTALPVPAHVTPTPLWPSPVCVTPITLWTQSQCVLQSSVCYTDYIGDLIQYVLHQLHCGLVPVCVTPITLWIQSQRVLHWLHCGPTPSACYTDYIVDPVHCVKPITFWTRSSACSIDYIVDPVHVYLWPVMYCTLRYSYILSPK